MDQKDLFIAIFALCALGGAVSVLRPLATALAKRIADGSKRDASHDQLATLRAELLEELEQVRQQVGDLAERVDFAERLLSRQREGERLAPPRS
jgi:hypothetical protein